MSLAIVKVHDLYITHTENFSQIRNVSHLGNALCRLLGADLHIGTETLQQCIELKTSKGMSLT